MSTKRSTARPVSSPLDRGTQSTSDGQADHEADERTYYSGGFRLEHESARKGAYQQADERQPVQQCGSEQQMAPRKRYGHEGPHIDISLGGERTPPQLAGSPPHACARAAAAELGLIYLELQAAGGIDGRHACGYR
jgi:hypothetical protein